MPVTYLSTEPACRRGIRVTCPPFPPLRCDLVLALPSEPAACPDSLWTRRSVGPFDSLF